MKGKTHTNKVFLTKYDLDNVVRRKNSLETIRYEQFLLDSVSTRELGMLTEALKTSKRMVRERKPEYLKKQASDKKKYFLEEALHFIETCDKESMDYLLGIDILLFKNPDYTEYNRRCIERLFEICGNEDELEDEW